MDSISRYITIGLTILLIGLFRYNFKKSIKDSKSSRVKQPRIYLFGGASVSIISIVLVLLLPFLPMTGDYTSIALIYIFFLLMIIIGLGFLWYYFIWEIQFECTKFTYRNLIGKLKTFEYKQCTQVTKSARIDVYFDGKRIVQLSALSNNWYKLIKHIKPNMHLHEK